MKQHMMTHKNRDGTPISADLLKSLERSRPTNYGGGGVGGGADGINSKSNSSDDVNAHEDGHKDGSVSSSANSSSASVTPPKEHCLSLTIQHSHHRASDAIKALSPVQPAAVLANCNGTSLPTQASQFRPTATAHNKKRAPGKDDIFLALLRLVSSKWCTFASIFSFYFCFVRPYRPRLFLPVA